MVLVEYVFSKCAGQASAERWLTKPRRAPLHVGVLGHRAPRTASWRLGPVFGGASRAVLASKSNQNLEQLPPKLGSKSQPLDATPGPGNGSGAGVGAFVS